MPVPADMAFVGEIGLSGELRAVSQTVTRVKEAAKLGFKRVVVPRTYRQDDLGAPGVEVIRVRTMADALAAALPQRERQTE